MARKLRLEFPGAVYHVINRGNYRHGVFAAEKTKADPLPEPREPDQNRITGSGSIVGVAIWASLLFSAFLLSAESLPKRRLEHSEARKHSRTASNVRLRRGYGATVFFPTRKENWSGWSDSN